MQLGFVLDGASSIVVGRDGAEKFIEKRPGGLQTSAVVCKPPERSADFQGDLQKAMGRFVIA